MNKVDFEYKEAARVILENHPELKRCIKSEDWDTFWAKLTTIKNSGESKYNPIALFLLTFWSLGIDCKKEAIPMWTFSGLKKLDEVVIPSSITKIGNNAFYESSIISLTIPGTIKLIPKELCEECRNLKTVTLGEGIRGIQEKAFYNCGIEEITIPNSVSVISYPCFVSINKRFTINLPMKWKDEWRTVYRIVGADKALLKQDNQWVLKALNKNNNNITEVEVNFY